MSTRPPTLREKRRYLLVSVEPYGTVIDQKDLHYTISDAITSLWGDVVAAVITSAVVSSEGQYFIIRCRRGTEQDLSVALSTITTCCETPIALRMVAASGTIDTLREKNRSKKTPDMRSFFPRECTFDKKLLGTGAAAENRERFKKAPRAAGFLLANAPKTAFIRISPAGRQPQPFQGTLLFFDSR